MINNHIRAGHRVYQPRADHAYRATALPCCVGAIGDGVLPEPYDRDLFVAQRLARLARTVLLPGSGIDLAQFVSQPSEEASAPVLLMVARLLRDKGVVEFADAARIVRKIRPDVTFELLSFLDVQNPTAIDRAMVEAWKREGILRYVGEAADVRPYVARATAVVLPFYREGLPRSLLEAASMGRPLIATDVPGCTEIARDGENAVLCAPRDAGAGQCDAGLARARPGQTRRDGPSQPQDRRARVRYVDRGGAVPYRDHVCDPAGKGRRHGALRFALPLTKVYTSSVPFARMLCRKPLCSR